MDNKVLIGAAALGAFFLLSGGSKGCTIKYDVPAQYSPTGQNMRVCESDLSQYGFIRYEGQYYHSSQFPPPGTGTGAGVNWQQWGALLQQGINAGLSAYAAVNTVIDQFTPKINIQPNWAAGTVAYEFDLAFKKVNGVVSLGHFERDLTQNIGWEVDTPFPNIMTFTVYKDLQPVKQKTVNFQLQQVSDTI